MKDEMVDVNDSRLRAYRHTGLGWFPLGFLRDGESVSVRGTVAIVSPGDGGDDFYMLPGEWLFRWRDGRLSAAPETEAHAFVSDGEGDCSECGDGRDAPQHLLGAARALDASAWSALGEYDDDPETAAAYSDAAADAAFVGTPIAAAVHRESGQGLYVVLDGRRAVGLVVNLVSGLPIHAAAAYLEESEVEG